LTVFKKCYIKYKNKYTNKRGKIMEQIKQLIVEAIKNFCSSLDNFKKADRASKARALSELNKSKETLLDLIVARKISVALLGTIIEALVNLLSFVHVVGERENPLELYLIEINPRPKDNSRSFFIYFYKTQRYSYHGRGYLKKGKNFDRGIELLIEKICQAATQAETIFKKEQNSSDGRNDLVGLMIRSAKREAGIEA
jgi:hypothetical protein